jgi:hypothetical protein
VAANVRAREHDRTTAGVGGKDAHVRRGGGNRDGDRPGAGADVDDASVAGTDAIERRGDELFARSPWRHDAAGSCSEGEAVEADLVHT